ncbi:MAG: ATP-binding cassette domain-containing protein [Chloroflexi bacterium]|nr:ATP-binding cassette domain-containing protein [Chloroflexota bacterium]
MTNMRPCPNCKTPQPVGQMRCANCGAQLTVMMSYEEFEPRLQIMPDGGSPATVRLSQKVLTIGSAPGQDIRLDYVGIAPEMAKLELEDMQYTLYDLTDYPGDVQVNGRFIEQQVLHSGDVIRLQDGKERGVTLTYLNPNERGGEGDLKTYPLDSLPFTIGRDESSSIPLKAIAVSFRHAQITRQGDGHVIEDLNSTNGTYVNDVRLTKPRLLEADDVIRIDRTLLAYKGDHLLHLSAVQDIQLSAVALEKKVYSVPVFRRPRVLRLMQDVSLAIQPKEFIAVIGGSGSGKSTLLRALNGANRATAGKVLVNGEDLYANYEIYQPIIGYVPQTDIVHDKLTVYESLNFAARLRFPHEKASAREQRISRALDAIQLTEFQDRLVGRLSGGQKKRVSIAIELMTEPRLLFMDEPSSGLDPGLDRSMMETLRRLANRGHVIVVVTHTTLNIGMCDKLALMVRGQLTFYGPPKDALAFFNVRDYTEIYNRVLQPPELAASGSVTAVLRSPNLPKISPEEAASKWADRFKKSALYSKYVIEARAAEKSGAAETALSNRRLRIQRRGTFWQQTQVLIERTFKLALRDIRTMLAMMVVLPLVGLFLGLISLDTIEGGRGKMLIDRFEGENALAVFIDALPLTPISEPPSSDNARGGPQPQVNGTATFTPASDAQRLLFMLALAVTLLGVFVAAYTIVEEKSLFLRERMSNLRIPPYLASKIVVYGGFALVSCLLALVTLSLGVQLPAAGLLLWAPLELFITLALTALAGVSIGLLISAFSHQINTVTYIVLAVLFVQILFAGVLFPMNGALEVPSRLTVTRWSLEALGATTDIQARDAESHFVVEVQPVNPRTGEALASAPPARQYYRAPTALSVAYADSALGLLGRWLALAAFSTVFLVVAGLSLRRDESF